MFNHFHPQILQSKILKAPVQSHLILMHLKKVLRFNINHEDIGIDIASDIDSNPVAKVDSRTKQHTKLSNLSELPNGVTSRGTCI